MPMTMNRRKFLERSAAVLAAVTTGRALTLDSLQQDGLPAIAAVEGKSVPLALDAALAALGGIKAFVGRGAKVVCLPNPQGSRPGVSTNPELMGTLVSRCLEAGAAEAVVASGHGAGRWYSTGIIEAVEKAGGKMVYPRSDGDWVEVPVPQGRQLKKAVIVRRALENDVLINVPIVKQHDSTRVTCTMKNLMGFNSDNGSWHRSDDYLEHAIAELASVIVPDLCVVDAITILTENGPFGPGRTVSPRQVVAGVNQVSVDAYCCRFLDLDPREAVHIRIAAEMKLGDLDISRLKTLESKV
jgi:uncharacterized protein (DUF362 family)